MAGCMNTCECQADCAEQIAKIYSCVARQGLNMLISGGNTAAIDIAEAAGKCLKGATKKCRKVFLKSD